MFILGPKNIHIRLILDKLNNFPQKKSYIPLNVY